MTKQITNNNDQISISLRQALLYGLNIVTLDLEYCLYTWNLEIGAYLEIRN